MTGGSYGGGIQSITAARDARVDVIAPNIAWHSLLTSLYKEEPLKGGWGSALCGSGSAARSRRPDEPGRDRAVAPDPHVFNTCVNGIATADLAEDRRWFAAHGPDDALSKVKIPTLIIAGHGGHAVHAQGGDHATTRSLRSARRARRRCSGSAAATASA